MLEGGCMMQRTHRNRAYTVAEIEAMQRPRLLFSQCDRPFSRALWDYVPACGWGEMDAASVRAQRLRSALETFTRRS